MKKIVIFILVTFFSCIFVANQAFAKSDEKFRVIEPDENASVILINQDNNDSKLDVVKLAKEGKMVYAFKTNDYVFDYYANEVLNDVHAVSYYYDENSVFTMEKLVFANSNTTYSSNKQEALTEHFDKSVKEHLKKTSNKLTSLSDISGEVVTDLDAGTENDFELPRVKYENTVIEPNKRGYFIYTSYLYRYFMNGITLYRVDSAVQFTSGNSAAVVEGYDDRYKAIDSQMSASLTKNVEYGYGVWYSNQPYLLDYYPHTTPVYRSITSGINVGLTIGRTQSATVSGGGTDTGASATSEFTSTFSFNYFYQATSEFLSPLLSSGELSASEGSFWNLTQWGPDRSVTVFPGSLIEVVPASYAMRYDGKYNMSISFHVQRVWLLIKFNTTFDYDTTIYLDNRI